MKCSLSRWFLVLGVLAVVGFTALLALQSSSSSAHQQRNRPYHAHPSEPANSNHYPYPYPLHTRVETSRGAVLMHPSPRLFIRTCQEDQLAEMTTFATRLLHETFLQAKTCSSIIIPTASGVPDGTLVSALYVDYCTTTTSPNLMPGLSNERYSLQISPHYPTNVTAIRAHSRQGLVWAFRSLSSLLHTASPFALSCEPVRLSTPVHVTDAPRVGFRSFLLDTARNHIPVRTIFSLVRLMSRLKLNVLHWHMIDDTTFGIEIDQHPALHQSQLWHYSKADIRQVIRLGEENGVRIVPELNVLSHASSWKAGYPTLIPRCPKWSCSAAWGLLLNIFSNDTRKVILDVLDEVTDLFPDPIIHLGGDEPVLGCWLENEDMHQLLVERFWTSDKSRCALDAVLRQTPGEDRCGIPMDAARYLMQQVRLTQEMRPFFELLARKGKKAIMWQENWEAEVHSANNTRSDPRQHQLGPSYLHIWEDSILPAAVMAPRLEGIIYASPWYFDTRCTQPLTCYDAFEEPSFIDYDVQLKFKSLLRGVTASAWEMDEEALFRYNVWARLAAVSEVFWTSKYDIAATALPWHERFKVACKWLDSEELFTDNVWATKLGYHFLATARGRTHKENRFDRSEMRDVQAARRAAMVCAVASLEAEGKTSPCVSCAAVQALEEKKSSAWAEEKARIQETVSKFSWGKVRV